MTFREAKKLKPFDAVALKQNGINYLIIDIKIGRKYVICTLDNNHKYKHTQLNPPTLCGSEPVKCNWCDSAPNLETALRKIPKEIIATINHFMMKGENDG